MPFVYLVPTGECYYILSDSTARGHVDSGEYTFDPPAMPDDKHALEDERLAESESIIIRINEADSKALVALDGIGAAKARLIIEAQPSISSVEALTKLVADINWESVTQDGKPVTILFDNAPDY